MDDETYRRLFSRARRIAEKIVGRERADDIAQDVIVRYIERGHGQSVKHAVIDSLRIRSGKSGLSGYSQRKALEYACDNEPRTLDRLFSNDSGESIDNRIDAHRMQQHLGDEEKKLIRDYFYEGLTLNQIGKNNGVSESRTHQKISRVLRRMRMNFDHKLTGLSRSERDIAKLLAQYKSAKEMAELLFVSEKTIKFHLTNIYRKLHLNGRNDFYALAADQIESNSATVEDEMLPTPGQQAYTQKEADYIPINQLHNYNSKSNVTERRPDGKDAVAFVIEKFRVDQTIEQLQTMALEVTKGDYSVEKVMAACQCIGRMNDTMNTVMKASQILKGF